MAAPKIALLVETSREYGRGILRGIIRYEHEHGPWSLYFKPQGLGAAPPPWLTSWRGDGILARIDNQKMATAVLRAKVPAVDLRAAVPGLPIPVVGISNPSVVRMAVEHFVERGFRHYAFYGSPRGDNCYQDERSDRFERLVHEKGFSCHVYQHARIAPASWEKEQRDLASWLKGLPKPIGVMTCHDDRGQQLLDAALRAGLRVPDEIAVLGVDNDPFLCNLSTPQLSSIDLDSERIGYEAAAVLDRMMQGDRPPRHPLLFEPRALVSRQSTDITAVSDSHVRMAAQLIRDHSGAAVGIEQILAKIPISRSALFRRFKEQLHRSPKDEMTRVRVERAKDLLRNTTMSVTAIAERTFYTDAKHFIVVFRRVTGNTPLHYRKQNSFPARGPALVRSPA